MFMSTSESSIAIIPARGGSKRFPRKNVAELDGKPLVAYAVEAGLESGVFDTVCVTSDDEEILAVGRDYGADLLHERPPELASDTAQVKEVCASLLRELREEDKDYSYFGVLWVTNPLRRAEDLKEAWDLFQGSGGRGVMSLVPFDHPPQTAVWAPEGEIVPYFEGDNFKRTQELDEVYTHDGAFILMETDYFLKREKFYVPGMIPYYNSLEHSVDIDTPRDLAWAEFLMDYYDLEVP